MMSAIGDTVHVLPLVNAIKRSHPASRITWVLQPGPASLVRGHPAVDEILMFDRSQGLRAFSEVTRSLRARTFDLLIDLQVYFKAGILTALSGARHRLGFDRARARDLNWLFTNARIPARPVQHVQDQYFEFATSLGIPHEPIEWGLGPWPEERDWQREFASRFDRPIAALVIGTSKLEKDWIPERWTEVSDVLTERYGVTPVMVGGKSPRETASAETITKLARTPPVSVLGSGLRKLVSILDASALVISPDTGPLHMAVALNRPVISLMGYTDPRRTGPYRRFHDLLIDAYHEPRETGPVTMATRTGRMQRISVADVLDRVSVWDERYRGKS